MSKSYDKDYFQKRDNLSWHLAHSIEKFIGENNIKSVLDVGCGTGKLVSFLNKHHTNAFGCDSSIYAVKKAQKNNKKGVIFQASATKLPFESSTFDLVLAISLIEHLTNNETGIFLKEARRVLKPSGLIFLVTPNFATPIRLISKKKWFAYSDPTHINFFTQKRLAGILSKSGFDNIKNHFSVPYDQKFDKEFPSAFGKFPLILKKSIIHLLFNSPLSLIRDSFWMSAQKK